MCSDILCHGFACVIPNVTLNPYDIMKGVREHIEEKYCVAVSIEELSLDFVQESTRLIMHEPQNCANFRFPCVAL